MKNLLREELQQGKKTLGMFHELTSASAVECMAYAGLDYVIIDTEHGPGDVESTLEYIRAAKGKGLTPLVRVKDASRNSILKMLDAGAMGLIIPNVQSVEQVKEIISYGKYFPIGDRGVAPTAGTSYWSEDYAKKGMEEYFKVNNRETMLIPQCETKGFVDDLEEIVKLDGIDGIFVGPYDLSTALGKPGDFADEEVKGVIQKVQELCKENGLFSFIYSGNIEAAKNNFGIGYDSVTYGMDALTLIEALENARKSILS